jgi:Asparagine synthase
VKPLIHACDGPAPRGLVIEAYPPDQAELGGDECRLVIRPPSHWASFSELDDTANGLTLLAFGHLYARDARTFRVNESLGLLREAWRRGGIPEVRQAIGGGMFVLVVIDRAAGLLCCLADQLSCMPLFFSRSRGAVRLGTSQFDLALLDDLSLSACLEYLEYGYLPFRPSLFQGVRRLGPGQILTLSFDAGLTLRVSDEILPVYPPLQERIRNPREACRRLEDLFAQYFGRLQDDSVAAGLSGGYDSRLVAAYAAEHNVRFVTWANPGTAEAETAERVAAILGTRTELFDIDTDAPARYLRDFRQGMQTLDSLEVSHVFVILNSLMQSAPHLLIDGFMGDSVVGGGYFYKLSGGLESPLKVLTGTDRYAARRRTPDDYIDFVLSGYGRRLDSRALRAWRDVGPQVGPAVRALIEQQMPGCPCHADMIEMLLYRFRARCVVACGPVSFLRRAWTLCPFYDRGIFETCLGIDKSLKAGDRLYNSFWRHRFPALARVPRERTGGSPAHGTVSYRLRHLRTALSRRLRGGPLGSILGSTKAGGDLRAAHEIYLGDPATRALLKRLFQGPTLDALPAGLPDILRTIESGDPREGRAVLRAASLLALLATDEQVEQAQS